MKVRAHLVVLLALVVGLAALAPPSMAAEAGTATKRPVTKATATPAAKPKADKPNAAERRAAGSKYESGKLDQSAFSDGSSSKGSSTKSTSNGGSAVRMIFGLLVVVGAIFAVQFLLKKWGKSRMEGLTGASGIIDVVATTTLAQGRAIHVVRVGSELVLVGATEQSITRLGDIAPQVALDLDVPATKTPGGFSGLLQGAMRGQLTSGVTPVAHNTAAVAPWTGEAEPAKPFIGRFIDNLRLSTAR